MKCCCSNCGWLEVNPSGAMFCGYSDERTWENESCIAWKDKYEPQTNADRIRAMTDEELAEWLEFRDDNCPRAGCYKGGCHECWIDWLKSPADKESKNDKR